MKTEPISILNGHPAPYSLTVQICGVSVENAEVHREEVQKYLDRCCGDGAMVITKIDGAYVFYDFAPPLMTEAEAITWVREQDEDSELDQKELEAAFHALYGRKPDEKDRQDGLWSLCCAANPGM